MKISPTEQDVLLFWLLLVLRMTRRTQLLSPPSTRKNMITLFMFGISYSLSHLCRFNSWRVKHETNRFVINSTLITIKPPYLTTEKSRVAVAVETHVLPFVCWFDLDLTAIALNSNKRAIAARRTTKLTTLKLKEIAKKTYTQRKQASESILWVKSWKKRWAWAWQALISCISCDFLIFIGDFYWINFHFHVHKCLRLRYDCGSDRQTISPIVPCFYFSSSLAYLSWV